MQLTKIIKNTLYAGAIATVMSSCNQYNFVDDSYFSQEQNKEINANNQQLYKSLTDTYNKQIRGARNYLFESASDKMIDYMELRNTHKKYLQARGTMKSIRKLERIMDYETEKMSKMSNDDKKIMRRLKNHKRAVIHTACSPKIEKYLQKRYQIDTQADNYYETGVSDLLIPIFTILAIAIGKSMLE